MRRKNVIRISLICHFFLSLCFANFCLAADSQTPELTPLFPFVISYDAPNNITNVASKIDAPAGKHGFVQIKDGHFATDQGPIRFWGTNLCFTANFPTQEQADRLTARLARLGYNCVRLHHMDTGNNSIVSGKTTQTELDRQKLDSLDYLIASLKQRGIYVNINLHVGRWLDDRDGFPHRDQRPNYDKGVGNFEPRMIELQKKYAKDLLTHVNPYTKLAYTHDPCVAMVEISNEDSIVSQWGGGELDTLPEPYVGLLRKLWNDWLRNKYATTDKLCKAWGSQIVPLGDELCPDADFTNDAALLSKRLVLQTDSQSDVEMWVVDGLMKLRVAKMGQENWIPQIFYRDCTLKKDEPYTLSIRIRSDKETTLQAAVRMDHEPWETLGGQKNLAIGPEWKTFDVVFRATQDDTQARVNLNGFVPEIIYEIDSISLKHGGVFGPKPNQTLEAGNLPLVSPFESNALPEMMRDYVDFLFSIEDDYWLGMYDYLKNELDVQSPVSGTQLNYGSTHVQAMLDYCDNHSYWNHPTFPGQPWDRNNWYLRNISLANAVDKGTFNKLASNRVVGKPYTVSEYDHPFPNEYCAEGQPMIAAFGRFQNWDGVFPFAYAHSENFEPQYATSFFDTVGNVGKVAHSISCYSMFVRGDVDVAKNHYAVQMSKDREIDIVARTKSARRLGWDSLGADDRIMLQNAIGVTLDGQTSANLPQIPKDQKRFVSDTQQICWDMAKENRGYMTVNTQNTKLLSGFVQDQPLQIGDVTLDVGKTRLGWCTISMVSYDGNGFGNGESSGFGNNDGKAVRLLIAATGAYTNTNMELQRLENDRVTVGANFGSGPTLCEGVPATITLPVDAKRVTLYPLDGSGNRKEAVKAVPTSKESTSVIKLGPEYKTVWYEVEIMPK